MIPWSNFSLGTCTCHPKIGKLSKNWLSGLCAASVRPHEGSFLWNLFLLVIRAAAHFICASAFSLKIDPWASAAARFHLCVRIFLINRSVSFCGRMFSSVRPHKPSTSSKDASKCPVRAGRPHKMHFGLDSWNLNTTIAVTWFLVYSLLIWTKIHDIWHCLNAVSYTHLTLPTNREV